MLHVLKAGEDENLKLICVPVAGHVTCLGVPSAQTEVLIPLDDLKGLGYPPSNVSASGYPAKAVYCIHPFQANPFVTWATSCSLKEQYTR